MKKLSIKAKAYDKAIESLRAAFYDGEEYRDACKRLIEPIFPELKESEDEKVRRELIKLLQECYDIDSGFFTRYCKVPFAQMLAWLEKQGERGTNGNEREIPNSAWSEEDERMFKNTIALIETLEDYNKAPDGFGDVEFWLKSLKDRVGCEANCTTTNEWSEEDYYNYGIIQYMLNNECVGKADKKNAINWLISLKERCTWKPSDEQLEALANALSLANNCGEESAFDLRTLHKQLKKLKG